MLLLITAGCLAGLPSWAQRAAVAPLMPLPPVLQSVLPAGLGEAAKTGVAVSPTAPVTPAATATRPVLPEPVYLLDAHIILGPNGLSKLTPQDIAKVDIYKTAASTPAPWRSLAAHGILSITLKPGAKHRLRTKSLTRIQRQLKLTGPVIFQLNGLPIESASLRVATQAIAGFDVLHHDAEIVVNIRLVPYRPTPLPPGSIYIRGVAGR
ncbi:hypothetical protein A8B98_03305 [Hymenobacter sp. UV11]|nr:hypothetical protein A8B98_03305 [Hymenobacter sp. UV11]